MSELIDQLRNLRAAAYRKLTQNSDFKVLLELDEMLGRLDDTDKPMAPPASPEATAGDSGEEEDGDEDTEAAPPEPEAEPPPAAGPATDEIQLADEALAEEPVSADEGEPDVLLMATADAGEVPGNSEPEAEAPAATAAEDTVSGEIADPEPAKAEDVLEASAVTHSAEETAPDEAAAEPAVTAEADTEAAEEIAAEAAAPETPEPAVAEAGEPESAGAVDVEDDTLPDETLADEEAVLAEALADGLGAGEAADAERPAAAAAQADVFSTGEDTAAAAVAEALSGAKPAPEPAPVNLAPEEDYDTAAPGGTAETSDDAYESALNRLNALIERASHRLKRDDGGDPNGASVA